MSLPRSSSPTAAETLGALLPAVVSDVAEQMFFGWAEACDADQATALVHDALADGTTAWIRVDVAFAGGIDGRLHLALPCDLAHELAAAMLGIPDDEASTSPVLDDVAGELANMICGAMLTRGEKTRPFEVLRPRISRGNSSAALASSTDRSLFTINERPMLVSLSFDGGGAS